MTGCTKFQNNATEREQRVTDEHRIPDHIGDAGRRVAGRVQDVALEVADPEGLALLEEVIELAAIASRNARLDGVAMTALTSRQVASSRAGSKARYRHMLLMKSVLRVARISSNTALTRRSSSVLGGTVAMAFPCL